MYVLYVPSQKVKFRQNGRQLQENAGWLGERWTWLRERQHRRGKFLKSCHPRNLFHLCVCFLPTFTCAQ